jgi:hypothetical protein
VYEVKGKVKTLLTTLPEKSLEKVRLNQMIVFKLVIAGLEESF